MSLYEGLSHTLLEASAIGIPCVASDCGGNPEIIQSGVNGILIPYGDVMKLREALQHLQNDEDSRFRLACAAKENSRRFDFEDTVRQTIKAICGDDLDV
jgi:glycosyltransferase involved in cell wall biosynthesis